MTEQPEGVSDAVGTADYESQSAESSGMENYHGYSVDDEDQPQEWGTSLVDNRGLSEPMDEGFSPPEKWSAAEGYGNTPLEEELGESLDQRVAQEEPEPDPYEEAATIPVEALEGTRDDQVGNERAGRLVQPDEGRYEDTEKDMVATDVGIDGAGASAEEAAVHVVDEE